MSSIKSTASVGTGTWAVDSAGRNADPVTLRVHGKLPDIERALEKTGWTRADTDTLAHDAKFVAATAWQEARTGARKVVDLFNHLPGVHLPRFNPAVEAVQHETVAAAFYRGMPILEAFQKNNNPLGGRDHFLLYRTGEDEYAIAPSKDSGLMFDPHSPRTAFVNHRSLPDTGGERDLVLADLTRGGGAKLVDVKLQHFEEGSVYGELVPDSRTYDVEVPARKT